MVEAIKRVGVSSEENVKQMEKFIDSSGLGPETCLLQALLENPPKLRLVKARKEIETVFFGAIDELLGKTWVQPNEIGILVVNSSKFCPTPSLCDMIVNRDKL
ncbi:3-ketoacyl-CoA synthase 20-like [Neltuma alba]|uniref:3-ketoacyl-CoA synthase 20-like n=1 Tax=Neltuma alba TaxID=207710 RepID=UPI0010A2BD16|nr:3-ketoacyl-CoA synthase 20-like [Prosopis alba]